MAVAHSANCNIRKKLLNIFSAIMWVAFKMRDSITLTPKNEGK